MDGNRFTEKVQEALGAAQRLATRSGQQQFDVEHLLLTLLEQEPGLAVSILRKANVDTGALKRRLEQEIARLPRVSGPAGEPEQVYVSPRPTGCSPTPSRRRSNSRTITFPSSTCCSR
jgi:ATP-dependent Clp protease ATP-binding subunit ClpB